MAEDALGGEAGDIEHFLDRLLCVLTFKPYECFFLTLKFKSKLEHTKGRETEVPKETATIGHSSYLGTAKCEWTLFIPSLFCVDRVFMLSLYHFCRCKKSKFKEEIM